MKKPIIAVPIGDPAGVGPEIVSMALADAGTQSIADCIIIGDKQVMEKAIAITGVSLQINVVKEPEEGDYRPGVMNLIDLSNIDQSVFEYGKVQAMCGKAAYA